jgi:hypothetical protein
MDETHHDIHSKKPLTVQNCSLLRLLSAVAHIAAMLSRAEIAKIKAEIEALEKARENCTDSGIRKLIDAWIEEQKKKLAAGNH